MPTILYQQIAAPVLPPSLVPESPLESKFHQAFSEPVRQKINPQLALALSVSANALTLSLFQENVYADKWFKELSHSIWPKRGLDAQQQQVLSISPTALTLQESVFESKFHQPWSEPVRVAPRLHAGLNQYESASESAQFPELTFYAKYSYPWSEPVRVPRRLPESIQQYFAFPTSAPTINIGWYANLSTPAKLDKIGISSSQQHAAVISPTALTLKEAVLESKFHQPWSEPAVKDRPALRAGAQQSIALVQAFFGENVFADKWNYQWSEPVRLNLRVRMASSLQQATTMDPRAMLSPESVTYSRWAYPWSEPVRTKPELKAGLQVAYWPQQKPIMPPSSRGYVTW